MEWWLNWSLYRWNEV